MTRSAEDKSDPCTQTETDFLVVLMWICGCGGGLKETRVYPFNQEGEETG